MHRLIDQIGDNVTLTLDDRVRVRLTDEGTELFNEIRQEIKAMYGSESLLYPVNKGVKGKFEVTTSLRVLFALFGDHFYDYNKQRFNKLFEDGEVVFLNRFIISLPDPETDTPP